jgi:hypothetical protein
MIRTNFFFTLCLLTLILLFGSFSLAEEGKTGPADTAKSPSQENNQPTQPKKTDPDCPPSAAKSSPWGKSDPFQTLTPPARMMEEDLAGEG